MSRNVKIIYAGIAIIWIVGLIKMYGPMFMGS